MTVGEGVRNICNQSGGTPHTLYPPKAKMKQQTKKYRSMKDKKMWVCIKDCDVEFCADGTRRYYNAGEIVEDTLCADTSNFLCITQEQGKQLGKILKSIEKEKAYQARQHLAIRNSHPRMNWKAEQRLTGSIQEARSKRARFNKIVSEIARREIEVFWDCKTDRKVAW